MNEKTKDLNYLKSFSIVYFYENYEPLKGSIIAKNYGEEFTFNNEVIYTPTNNSHENYIKNNGVKFYINHSSDPYFRLDRINGYYLDFTSKDNIDFFPMYRIKADYGYTLMMYKTKFMNTYTEL